MRFPFRGVIVFALMWATLWTLPAFRVQNERALQSQSKDPFSAAFVTDEEIGRARREAPNDAFLESQQLQGSERAYISSDAQKRARFFEDYDALIARHPGDVALRRNRLRLATTGNIVPLRYTNRFMPELGQAYTPTWLNARQLEDVVLQARAAQKIAPNDAFFPWIEAMALWGLNRENESLSALEKAGRCSHFNDGSVDEARQRLALINRFRPLEGDDKLMVVWAALFPHFAGMRGLAREVAYSGTDRFRAGDKAGAWKRWETVMRAGRAMRSGQSSGSGSTIIGVLVGEAVEQVAWDIAAQGASGYKFKSEMKGGSTRDESGRRAREGLAAFAGAARRDGHESLATWAKREEREIAARRASRLGEGGPAIFNKGIGWQSLSARLSLQLRWVGLHAMWWALVGAFGWALAMLLSRGGRDTRVDTNTIARLSAFLGALWIALAALAVALGAGLGTYWIILGLSAEDSEQVSKAFDGWDDYFWWAVGATVVVAIMGREWSARRRLSNNKERRHGFDSGKAATYAAWIIALVLSLCLWFFEQNSFSWSLGGNTFFLWLAWAASLALAIGAVWRERKGTRALPFALNAALSLVLFVLCGQTQRTDALDWACLLLCVFTVGFWIWNAREGLFSRTHIRANLEVGGRVVANVALLVSLFYVVATIALWPARRALNERVEHYIQLGEVDWLRANSK